PTQQAADATEQVAVTTFEDFRTADVPDGISQQALSWLLASWRPLSLLGLALASLFWFWLSLRRSRHDDSSPCGTMTDAGNAADDAWREPSRVPSPHWRETADPAIRRQLSELVEADPETAAGILRNWIGRAS
ncbi:MAG: hypothetical protein LLG00_03480, partial [Planctomycetaceae bacterium]|nr:hypothetical protein [Planctomycetaceae bacterium]